MSYVWQRWLADALRAEGCKVSEYDGWKDRGRPSSTGNFDPYGVLHHHTGTHTTMDNPCPTLATCVHGRSDLPGPLAHVVIGRDGTCHVIAAGRANHGGECNGNGPTSSGDANAQLIGFEIDYSGSQPVSDPQADASIRATAAVLKHFHRDASYVRGHKETSTTGKWDPGCNGSSDPAYRMDQVRSYVANALAGGGGKDDDMPAWVALTTTEDQTIAPGAVAVVKYDHEASDTDGAHSEDTWQSAIRPPSGYKTMDVTAYVNITGGDPGDLMRLALVTTPVDDTKPDTVAGYQDTWLGANGAVAYVFRYALGCGNDRRYRLRVDSGSAKMVTILSGAQLRAHIFK